MEAFKFVHIDTGRILYEILNRSKTDILFSDDGAIIAFPTKEWAEAYIATQQPKDTEC